VAELVKIVGPKGEWYEEIDIEKALALGRTFGPEFDVHIDQVLEIFGQTDVIFGTTVGPGDITSDDQIIGTCHL
jgi:hypothetical protein